MELVLFWLIFSIVVAVIASHRGRSAFGWFLLSCLISPLLAVILVLALRSLSPAAGEPAPTPETHVRCPDCREYVRMDARVCRHCGCKLVPQTPAGQPIESAAPPPGRAVDLDGALDKMTGRAK